RRGCPPWAESRDRKHASQGAQVCLLFVDHHRGRGGTMIPQGGTFVRPGALAWDGVLGPAPVPGVASCEAMEQASAAALADVTRLDDLLEELARARLWLPLPLAQPGEHRRVTDGSAIVLPLITSAGAAFVPAFTSVQRLATWADP